MRYLRVLLIAGLCVPTLSAAADAGLRIRNTGPVANLYGLPRPVGGDVLSDQNEWMVGLDYGNTFTAAMTVDESAYLDGETAVVSLALRAPLADRWEWGMELPWVAHKDGALDGFIDGWHDFFNMPEGGRNRVPRGRLSYRLEVDGQIDVNFRRDRAGLGDPRFWVGRSLYEVPQRSGALRLQVKAPIGRVDDLTGSEALDAALWWEHEEHSLFGVPRLSMSSMMGATYLGGGALAAHRQKRFVGVGSLGFGMRISHQVRFNLQADMHSALFDADIGELGDDSIQGTIGGRVRIGRQLWLDLGVVENLVSDSAPDVVFLLQLSGRW